MMGKIIKCLMIFGLSVTLAVGVGCKKSEKKTETGTKTTTTAKKTDKTAGASAEPASTTSTSAAGAESDALQKPEEVYTYSVIRSDGKMKRDPFTPIQVEIMGPVERFDVGQMGINGIIIHGVKTANVQTPDGVSTQVHVGDKIGVNGGVVVDISLDGLIVRETYLDVNGRIQEYERVIKNGLSTAKTK